MASRNVNIYLREDIYQEIKQASDKNVSRLINEIVSEYLTQRKIQREEELKLKMIAGYQENGLDQDSKILLCYPYAIEKELRLDYQIGVVNEKSMAEIKKVWEIAISW